MLCLDSLRNKVRDLVYRNLDYIGRRGRGNSQLSLATGQVNKKIAMRNYANFAKSIYASYSIDNYQVKSLRKILLEAANRDILVIICAMPISQGMREAVGKTNLRRFISTLFELSKSQDCIFLDYISGYSGQEYSYYDGSHFTDACLKAFSGQLGKDISCYMDNYKR